ncbi:MAG: RNA 3'-terminal phosphate cyclase [Candidatus Thorarchaeota archaeon]
MIEIDGSHGEGGGQILRTSVALSALTMKPIRVVNIRSRRPKPGLKFQHVTGIELTGQLVDAEVTGLEVGSTELEFVPHKRRGGSFKMNIGTAGSISLVLQAVLPAAVLSPNSVRFTLTGGTDVKWSPPVDYLQHVFGHMLKRMGPEMKIRQVKRGHYPRGGGIVECDVIPSTQLNPINEADFGEPVNVEGISHCVKLPSHVAERQARTAEKIIRSELGLEPDIHIEHYPKENDPHLGPGSGIVLWAESNNGLRLGADSLGERGVRAESVGKRCANRLVDEVLTGRAVDSHLCDMLIPYLAVASGKSIIGVTEITSHLLTNISTVREVLGTSVEVEGESGKPGMIEIQGSGFSL